jgi:hypothetical protein
MKKFIFQRVFRINYIKTELNQLVSKSLFKNTYNSDKNSITTTKNSLFMSNKFYSISFFRLYSMIDLSPKLVNKNYRLSRFSMNKLAKNANISGFVKRGW